MRCLLLALLFAANLMVLQSLAADTSELTETFGKLKLIDKISCGDAKDPHEFHEDPVGSSRIQTVLGKMCRTISPVKGESSYFTYRIGAGKNLQSGKAYVLVVEYPEDAPRSMIVCNTGNETIRGFHSGTTVGDALHNRFVNHLCESLDMPLSGKWEQWTHFFYLHDRFPNYNQMPRGAKPRDVNPKDGFFVNLAQFSARNDPTSKGIAVATISLYEILTPAKLTQKINYPKGLPKRRIFWREEMADGVIAGMDNPRTRGLDDFRNWYRYKAELMRFLGMNTFTKDLLEFGANQGWDSTPYGGNEWVYFSEKHRNHWPEIVKVMGKYGFDLLPYYEYSGSKGYKGLGSQKRCRPLKRSDGFYTHIKWIENANADITDPDTYKDFQKMLDLTVINEKDKAQFAGVWIRPRAQMPVSFSDAALKRFADESKSSQKVTREELIRNRDLYNRYIDWWGTKRRDFLAAMRKYLIENGIKDPVVLYTDNAGEPGVGFGTWQPFLVTDQPEIWKPILARADQKNSKGETLTTLTPQDVVSKGMYLKGLTSPGLNWGSWEWQHSSGANDPQHYHDTEGVMITHAFNRRYTVDSAKTLDLFRSASGLAIVRHYGLNEAMMHGKNIKQNKLGYFTADMERAGPYCMQAEALAMANGDPTMIGYLSGGNFGRGFPKYVRAFNAAFLSLPALPSSRKDGYSSDKEVVVREIKTKQGVYLAVVNTSTMSKKQVLVMLPKKGTVVDLVTGKSLRSNGKIKLSFYPYQLRSFRIN